MKEKHVVSSFYKYTEVKSPLKLHESIRELCNKLELTGRILLGEEGLNGCVCGSPENVDDFKKALRKDPLFSDMDFKDTSSEKNAYRKLVVRIRKEIVNSSVDVDLKNTGRFITPGQLKEMLDRKDDVTLVDMRNDYEARIGKFRGARVTSMRNFRDLPKVLHEIEDLKEKKVVTYCTGGIRCEKASAFLRENGFKDVMQIKGGILKFGEEFPDTYWEGKCFVFDDRLAIPMNSREDGLSMCQWCSKKEGNYVNCHNLECDKLFVVCDECKRRWNASCSEGCANAPKRRKKAVSIEVGTF